jgi:1-acyl-sn-glycerol-3-phosphate acyltransferase
MRKKTSFKNIGYRPHFFHKLYAFWFALVFAVTFLLLFPLFRIYLSKKKWYRKANNLRQFWARWILLMSGMGIQLEYESELNPDDAFVFASNHTSYLDIISLALAVKGDFFFMAKESLKDIPLFGLFFKTVDIPVNRRKPIEAAAAYKQASLRIQKGISPVIFPEGTIGTQVPNLMDFKSGAFKMAIENQVPVVPVTLTTNWQLLPDGIGFIAKPGKSKVFIHKPIPTLGLNEKDVANLQLQVFEIIKQKLIKEKVITA